MTNLKQRLETYCKYWRFKNQEIPKIEHYINNYVKNVLKKEPEFVPVGMDCTRISLRKANDTNFQDGLHVQIDWFDKLKKFEDILNPPAPFFIRVLDYLADNKETRIFSRKNFEDYYFYFEYHGSSTHRYIENILTDYQKLLKYTAKVFHITNITESNSITFISDIGLHTTTPAGIEKRLTNIGKLA